MSARFLSPLSRFKRVAILLPLVASVACNLDNSTSPSTPTGFVQFINAAPRYAAADFYVDSVKVSPGQLYGIDSLYAYVPATSAPQTFVARLVNDTTTIASTQFIVKPDTFYTVVLTQHTTNGGFLVLPDTVSEPHGGNAEIRVVNVAPTAGAVDVYITAPTTDLSTVPPSASNVLYEALSPYIPFAPAPMRVRVTATGTKTPVLLDVNPATLSAGQAWTILMLDAAGGGSPSQSAVLVDRSF